MIGPSSICLGVELDAPGLGLAGALGGHPPSAALRQRAGPVVALVLAATPAASGAGRAGQVGQEREPGPVDPGGHVGITVTGGPPR